MKKYYLWFLQRIIHFLWKNFEWREFKCWSPNDPQANSEGWYMKKRSCPQVYYKRGEDSIAINLYFSMGGFYVGHKGDHVIFKK